MTAPRPALAHPQSRGDFSLKTAPGRAEPKDDTPCHPSRCSAPPLAALIPGLIPTLVPALISALVLTVCLCAPHASVAQLSPPFSTNNEIKPPFNLRWGETSDRLEALVVAAGGKVSLRRPARGGREAIEVAGLPQEGLKKTVFYFKLGALTGVELIYQTEDWPEERYNAFMAETRRRISERHGEGQQIVRRTEKVGVSGVTQTVTGYKWVSGAANVQLIYFSASDGNHSYQTVSVHFNAF